MRTDWNDDFVNGLQFIRRFADRYHVIGPMTMKLTFANQRDSEHFKAGLKMDCKEIFYDLNMQSKFNIDKFEMMGFHVEIEHWKR
jgi:hypothetical protein